MSIYTVENFTSDITVEGYIAEFRDEPHFLELCKQCTNYGKSWGCPPFDFVSEMRFKYEPLAATYIRHLLPVDMIRIWGFLSMLSITITSDLYINSM